MWDIISGILGIVGFLFSVINLVYTYYTQNRKIRICVKDYKVKDYTDNKEIVAVFYRFENLSHLNTSFSDVQLIIDDNYYNLDINLHEAKSISHSNKKYVHHDYVEFTDQLPINLLSLQSHSGFLVFAVPQGILSNGNTTLTLRIWTSRGDPFQKTFVLGEDQVCYTNKH